MKNTTLKIAAVVLLLILMPPLEAERWNQQITITAGTPIRVTLTPRTYADRLFIQSRHNNTGLVYVLMGVAAATTCDATSASQLTAELGPGDATHPGSSLSDPQGAPGNSPPEAEDASQICIDGSHSGDLVIVSMYRRN